MVDGHKLSTLSQIFKVHYEEAVNHTIAQTAYLWERMKRRGGFKKTGGGRQIEWPYEIARGSNTQPGYEGGFLPGSSGNTGDQLDAIEAVTAVVNEKRIYSGVRMDGFFKADSHKKYLFKEGHNYSKLMQYLAEDFGWNLQRMFLGDETGLLGIQSGANSLSGSDTLTTLKAANTADARGRLGNAAFRVNQKVLPIAAADWAADPRDRQADLIGGNTFLRVKAISQEYDVGASPTITLEGDHTSDPSLTDGTAFVLANSRTSQNGAGGTSASLYELQGILNFIDDGTLGANLYGLSRTTYPSLKSRVDLSDSALRTLTPKLLQGLVDDIDRKVGDMHKVKGYELLSEQSVRTEFAANLGEDAKRYIQEAKGIKAVGGQSDVTMAFLGNDGMVPWRTCRDVPYGHVFYFDPGDIEAFISKDVGPMDDDGLVLRQVSGKDEWVAYYKFYGELVMQEPWKAGRLSGVQGYFR